MIRRCRGSVSARSGSASCRRFSASPMILELAFDGRLRKRVASMRADIHALGEALDIRAGPVDIRQQDARVRLHF